MVFTGVNRCGLFTLSAVASVAAPAHFEATSSKGQAAAAEEAQVSVLIA